MREMLQPQTDMTKLQIAARQKDIYKYLVVSSQECLVSPFGLSVGIFTAARNSAEAKLDDLHFANPDAMEPWKNLSYRISSLSYSISFNDFVLQVGQNMKLLEELQIDLLLGYKGSLEALELSRIDDDLSNMVRFYKCMSPLPHLYLHICLVSNSFSPSLFFLN